MEVFTSEQREKNLQTKIKNKKTQQQTQPKTNSSSLDHTKPKTLQ